MSMHLPRAFAAILFLSLLTIACAPAGTGPFGQDPDIVKPDKPLVKETVYTNPELGFTFTIPKGWLLTGGSPDSDSCSFSHLDRVLGFHMSTTAMSDSFPVKTSVKASLNQAVKEMQEGIFSLAERLDKEGEANGCTGWLTEDGIPSAEQGENPSRRIIWQCYDKDKRYLNITVSGPAATFDRHRETLMGIIDSVAFQ